MEVKKFILGTGNMSRRTYTVQLTGIEQKLYVGCQLSGWSGNYAAGRSFEIYNLSVTF